MKFEWLKYIKDILPGLVKSKLSDLATQALLGLSGFQAWIAKIVVKKLIKYLDINFQKLVIMVYNNIQAKIKEREYQNVVQNPDSSAEDIADAARDLIRGKR